MQKIFNKDGFNWWIGVVENRMDPEKMGRCKVRIFGYHTESKTLLPTKDLPWCMPIQPITSAANSGIGSSPLGPIEGTWVIGFFLDGEDMQQPAMFGTISTKVAQTSFASQEGLPSVLNSDDGYLKDKNGEKILDSSGNPTRVGTPPVDGWELGQTSEKYESGGRGPGTINNYNTSAANDFGGASYGTYQFASYLPVKMQNGNSRPSSKNSPVLQFIKSCKFKNEFAGLEPATAAFDAKWKEVASKNTTAFDDDQHEFVKRNYYDVYISNLQRNGIDLTKFGPAVQDLAWSTAVQFGPANTSVFVTPLKGKSQLSDKDIVNLVSEYKINTVNQYFKSSSASIQTGVKSRYQDEKKSLLGLITV